MLSIRPTRSRRAPPTGSAADQVPEPRTGGPALLDSDAPDREAFAVRYDVVAGLVYANIRRVLDDTVRTDAVADAAFAEVWRQAGGFEPSWMPPVVVILDLAHQLAAERQRGDLIAEAANGTRGGGPTPGSVDGEPSRAHPA